MFDRGHKLVADDIVGVDLTTEPLTVLPGFPHLKLWPDSVASLGRSPETLPKLRPELEKRGYRIDHGFTTATTPLRCIYVLNQGEKPTIEQLSPRTALFALMPNWYGTRFGKELLQAFGVETHFAQCSALAKRAPVYLLSRPASLERLPEVTQLVETHILNEPIEVGVS
jgi:hypothetical protein